MSLVPTGTYNKNGGYYISGRSYGIDTKMRVRDAYLNLYLSDTSKEPSAELVAMSANVGKTYAWTVINEIKKHGDIHDPRGKQKQTAKKHQCPIRNRALEPVHEIFLLLLRSENSARPLSNYIALLQTVFGVEISKGTLSKWFRDRFDYKGTFRKANLVPVDKFKAENPPTSMTPWK